MAIQTIPKPLPSPSARMLKFSYGIIFELPVAKWPSGNVPAHCSTFKAQGGREYVQYVETLAKAGEMIKVGNVKPKRLFPNTLDQVMSLTCVFVLADPTAAPPSTHFSSICQ